MSADVVERLRVAVARHRAALQRVEPPHVVDAEDVIGVAVREEDRVDAADVVAQRLRAQVGPGVDQDARRRASRRRWTAAAACRADRSSGRSSQSQPIIGTPCDVPVPRNVMRIADGRHSTVSRLDDALLALLGLHEAHAQLVQQVVDELRFGLGEVARGLLLQHRDDLDHLPGGHEVRLGRLAGAGIGDVAEVHGGRRRQREHEAGESDAGLFLVFHFAMLA